MSCCYLHSWSASFLIPGEQILTLSKRLIRLNLFYIVLRSAFMFLRYCNEVKTDFFIYENMIIGFYDHPSHNIMTGTQLQRFCNALKKIC